jgi:hypothetical protein
LRETPQKGAGGHTLAHSQRKSNIRLIFISGYIKSMILE